MTDINRLSVSLTKHGAHKVAELIKAFPSDEVLSNTRDSYRDINIDRAQAEKNLSANDDGTLPDLWMDVRELGDEEVDNLLFIGIIFSHQDLIRVFTQSSTDKMQGKLTRGEILSSKAYTNTAHILDELGFSVQHTSDHVVYDLRKIFINDNLSPLVLNLLEKKLYTAAWDGSGNVIDECLNCGFHEVFSISDVEFRDWLLGKTPDPYSAVDIDSEDADMLDQFKFKKGHNPRPGGKIPAGRKSTPTTIHLLHNEIQNELYNHLVDKYDDRSVGTEVSCLSGNVDIVLFHENVYTFFEIKTELSLRKCIRQAIAQLIEYAYWPDDERAKILVIVSPNPPTNEARRFLSNLRTKFGLPIYYQEFNRVTNKLGNRI
jgi:hypothetical protein